MVSRRQRMLKAISIESSRREMTQRHSVELCGDTGRQVPVLHPSPAHSPLGTHVDTGGIEGALAGDMGDGAGGQQRLPLTAQCQPDGDGHSQQAGQAAQAAAGAQGKNHPFLREGREEGVR